MLGNKLCGIYYRKVQKDGLIKVPPGGIRSRILKANGNKAPHDNDVFYTVAHLQGRTVFVAEGETFDTILTNIRQRYKQRISPNVKSDFRILSSGKDVCLYLPDRMMRALTHEEESPRVQIDEFTHCLLIRPKTIAERQDSASKRFLPA